MDNNDAKDAVAHQNSHITHSFWWSRYKRP